MAKRPNVAQHVVPECYIKHFADSNGTIYVQDKASGTIFPSGPDALCKEREIYTLIVDRKRNFSFESINNNIESALGPILNELRGHIDLSSIDAKRRIFTLLAAFTANLIARSRVLRKSLDNSLDQINQFLADHPDFFDDFPEDQYQQFLRNPEAFPEILKEFPGGAKYLGILRESNRQNQTPSGVDDTIKCLMTVKSVHYQVLLKARTAATAELIVEIGAKADLLTTREPRFISGDDPVIFLANGRRQTRAVPTNVGQWTDADRGVYLPLNPNTAILWSADGNYSVRPVSAENVHRYNEMVKENAIRHVIAADRSDLIR